MNHEREVEVKKTREEFENLIKSIREENEKMI